MVIRVGCIGLGVFGARIAARLAEEGFFPMVYDAHSDPIRYFLLKTSADIADAPTMMAEACDMVITVLPTAADVRAVALGRASLADAKRPRCVLVDMGTSGAAETKALAEALAPRGIPVLEAPVCGTPMDAKAGRLIIPVGGEEALIERCMPVFQALGRQVLRTGPLGSAHAGAALAEYLRAAGMLAAGEALAVAHKLGMAPQALVGHRRGLRRDRARNRRDPATRRRHRPVRQRPHARHHNRPSRHRGRSGRARRTVIAVRGALPRAVAGCLPRARV